MEFVSKYDMTFLSSVNAKYNKRFKTFDDYSLFIFELTNNEPDYYCKLEEDLKEYCKHQQERKNNYGKSKS